MLDRIAKFFCSLRLTVVLLCAGIVLIFVGTLAQVHEGLFAAQVRYFKSWYVWKPTIGDSNWPILLPGGYLLGTLLLLNLVAAHIKRFQFTRKKIAIQLIHGGLMLLILGQLLTDVFSRESSMRLEEGTSANFSEDFRANELVFIDTSAPSSDRVISIPESIVASKADIHDANLPLTVRVRDYWQNCIVQIVPPKEAVPASADHGIFTNMAVLKLPPAEPGTDQGRVAALVEVVTDKGVLGTFLVPSKPQQDGQQTFEVVGKAWEIACMFAPAMGGNLLAVSRAEDMGGESMATFPEARLVKNAELKQEGLPFKLRVKEFWSNCRLYPRPTAKSVFPHVTEGLLTGTFVTPEPRVTDSDHRDLPGTLIELFNEKGSLGSWLLWSTPGQPGRPLDAVDVAGKEYRIAFQAKRYYSPYSIGLMKFDHDKYKGTDTPKNFSSRVRLVNPQGHEDREVLIKMNSPLRYAGTTYYQASFDKFNPHVTILEVVKNPSWLTPYLACVVVGLGLIIQFMSHLIGFATKRRNA